MDPIRALIVDDSRTACVVLARALKKYGIESDRYHNGQDALEFLKHTRPNIIFMDNTLPGGNLWFGPGSRDQTIKIPGHYTGFDVHGTCRSGNG